MLMKILFVHLVHLSFFELICKKNGEKRRKKQTASAVPASRPKLITTTEEFVICYYCLHS